MKSLSLAILVSLTMLFAFSISCSNISSPSIIQSTYSYIKPEYDNIQLTLQDDSIEFVLDEDSYNQIRSINYFDQQGASYVSFYDARSKSINIYNFWSKKLEIRIDLKKWLTDSHFKYTTASVLNFDSIFVSNIGTLYLFDSAGVMKKKIECKEGTSAIVAMDNSGPLIVKRNVVFTGVKSNVDDKSLNSLRKWRALYMFDLDSKAHELLYQLPEIYRKNIFGEKFLSVGYCLNDRGNFVFSFPADTNIYETDLMKYHAAYYGKSKLQLGPIMPVPEAELRNNNGFKQYVIRDSYGPIYYDPYKKRYIRLAKQKISEELYETNKWTRQSSFIIFDENFKIIGESKFPADLSYSSIFFTPDGGIYSRVNSKDEYALHFVRLAYDERKDSLLANK